MKTKRLTLSAILLAMSLVIFIVESQLPEFIPIPGIKLGLANVITLISLYTVGKKESFIILILRIILGSIFTGNMITALYSLCGGVFCFFAETAALYLFKKTPIWVVSIFGAIFHNVGQLLTAVMLTATPAVLAYLPILLISGTLSGTLTGLCAKILITHNKNMIKSILKNEDFHE